MNNSLQSSKLVLLLAIALVLFLNTELDFLTAAGALDSDSKQRRRTKLPDLQLPTWILWFRGASYIITS
ncbi:unnamed protein product [Arabidopsis thaliana]|uniref:(thale cress) hypothetical protein n=1 Tax=Arabidopsis thaliana TaxID=3702 RepID=A0A7G2F2K1_ARATH|nr:unnamed protein product [Arabidopsis thaliana]